MTNCNVGVSFFLYLCMQKNVGMDGNVRHKWEMVGIGALLHFLVDGLCLCCLYLLVSPFNLQNFLGVFILYNVLAFLTQPLTGLWADRMRDKHWMLLLSVILLALAVLTMSFHSSFSCYLVPVLAGMGNSFFHVWGGKQVILKAGNDMRALGLFVSTGAFGLAVSMVFSSMSLLFVFLLAISLLAVVYVRLEKRDEGLEINSGPSSLPSGGVGGGFLLFLIVAFVVFRSFMGESFSSAIVKNDMVVLLVGLIAMLGKMAGGWLACRLGVIWMMAIVLTVALGCLLCRSSERYVMLTGLFAINCTMPVTLYWANNLLKGREGLAFGLLAAALIPGYLLTTL